jgi:hypothetical protein
VVTKDQPVLRKWATRGIIFIEQCQTCCYDGTNLYRLDPSVVVQVRFCDSRFAEFTLMFVSRSSYAR